MTIFEEKNKEKWNLTIQWSCLTKFSFGKNLEKGVDT